MNRIIQLHNPLAAAPPPPASDLAGIQIQWQEGAKLVVRIRFRKIDPNSGGLHIRPVSQPAHAAPPALDDDVQKLFVARRGGWAL